MKNRLFKTVGFILILVLFTFSLGFAEAPSTKTIQIPLVYPQNNNAPKREVKRKELPVVVKGEIYIDIVGGNPKQLKNPNLYVEYFLDSNLIYSTQNVEESDRPEKNSLGFIPKGREKKEPRAKALEGSILDTRLYPNGKHTLVVNLWDKDSPSAIGIREIVIQNQNED